MTIETELSRVWEQLRAKYLAFDSFLQTVRIQNLRGISDLTVDFRYPVTVIAGMQGCGKSTVLFSLASAYSVPGAGVKDFVPSAFFPSFSTRDASISEKDALGSVKISFSYKVDKERLDMTWSKGRGWNRSFSGRKGANQPRRKIYLRTLANLANPGEVRGVLQMSRLDLERSEIDPALIQLAQRIIPFKYTKLVKVSSGRKEVLFAYRTPSDGVEPKYSEFHMSGGERAVLRLSAEISQLTDSLVLIDEIEAALHPYTQQVLMLELQRLALRNRLQIVVTTHSPAILDTVPPEARIFLERKSSTTVATAAYRDIVQSALYGRTFNKLSILCEDEVAESIVRGIFDVINPTENLNPNSILIGKNSGKGEFPAHIRTIAKFGDLDDFIFILDGDASDVLPDLTKAANSSRISTVLLPGDEGPEKWIYDQLEKKCEHYSSVFGVDFDGLASELARVRSLYESATVKRSERFKYMIEDICLFLVREKAEMVRTVARHEAEAPVGEMSDTANSIVGFVSDWRQRS